MLTVPKSDAYTPPFYSTGYVGYGVDYHLPQPPFILPKVLWRYYLSPYLEPALFGLQVAARFVAALFGFDPGVMGYWDRYESAPRYMDGGGWVGNYEVDEGLGMDGDAYI